MKLRSPAGRSNVPSCTYTYWPPGRCSSRYRSIMSSRPPLRVAGGEVPRLVPVEHLLQLVLGVVQLVEVAVERAALKAHRHDPEVLVGHGALRPERRPATEAPGARPDYVAR